MKRKNKELYLQKWELSVLLIVLLFYMDVPKDYENSFYGLAANLMVTSVATSFAGC